MRTVLIILFALHGLIHLLGFAKAFQFASITQLTQPISRPIGLLWMASGLLFLIGATMYALKLNLWWTPAMLGIILSQILVFMFWQDAKFGTIANLLLLVCVSVGFGTWNLQKKKMAELSELLSESAASQTISEEALKDLPSLVSLWLYNSGALQNIRPSYATVSQVGEMKTTPDGNWYPFTATHWCISGAPGFLWAAQMNILPGVDIAVRDKYVKGEANMLVNLLSTIRLGDASGPDIDQGALLRYLAEIVWVPSFAISPHIQWEQLNNLQVRATITYGEQTGSATFTFNRMGLPIKVEAQRYYYRKEGSTLEPWLVTLDENSYKSFNGVAVPMKAEITWKLKEGDYKWFKLELKEVKYF